MESDVCQPCDGGVRLRVRLTPNAASDRIDGLETAADGRSHLKCRVRAVPEKGAANAALEKLLARALRAPKSAVSVIGGATARMKTVRINTGVPANEVIAHLTGKDAP